MKVGWIKSKLADVLIELRNGTNCQQLKDEVGDRVSRIETISTGHFNTSKVGYALLSEAQKERFRLLNGDILFSHINSPPHVGKVALFDIDIPVYQGINLLLMRPDHTLEPKFLYYFLIKLREDGYWLKNCKQSVNQASVNQKDIGRVEIVYPSLDEQRRIVAVLDKAFAGIATASANAQENLVNVERLFRTIIETVISNVLSPKNAKLSDLTEIRSGGTPSRQQKAFWNGDIPWYSSGELGPTYTNDPREMISDAGLSGSSAKIFPAGSLLIGMYDTAALKMSLTDRSATFNQAIAGVMPSGHLNLEYVRYAIEAQRNDILSLRRGVRQKNLNLSKICDVEIPVPTLIAQREAATKLNEARKLTDQISQNLKCKLQMIEALKQSLLQRAFAGELT